MVTFVLPAKLPVQPNNPLLEILPRFVSYGPFRIVSCANVLANESMKQQNLLRFFSIIIPYIAVVFIMSVPLIGGVHVFVIFPGSLLYGYISLCHSARVVNSRVDFGRSVGRYSVLPSTEHNEAGRTESEFLVIAEKLSGSCTQMG